jgi:hypothetical protein
METFISFLTMAFRLFFKFFLGLFVVPLGMILHVTWKSWEDMTGIKKILWGLFFVPAAGFLLSVGKLWDEI